MNKDKKTGAILNVIFGIVFSVVGIIALTKALNSPNSGFEVFMFWGILGLLIGQIFFYRGFKLINKSIFPVLFVLEIIAALVFVVGWQTRPTVQSTATKVCSSGVSIAEAKNFSTNQGIHPIVVVFKATSQGPSTSEYPEGWLPTKISDMQLVACVDKPEWKEINTCHYEDFSEAISQQQSQTITIISVVDAKVVGKFTITGGNPRPCASTESFEVGQHTKYINGEEISTAQILEKLNEFVSP